MIVDSPVKLIEGILFDMNSTLRLCEPHQPTQAAMRARILELLGKTEADQACWDELEARYQAYKRWVQVNMTQLSEGEIWTRWMLPDHSSKQVEAAAAELMLAWTWRRGTWRPKAEAAQTLASLRQRGYRLGIISNSLSSLDIPCFLQKHGWEKYFETVSLSAISGLRKPAPEPFLEAARALRLTPIQCAYVGNRLLKDIYGCRKAGFGLAIMIVDPASRPDEGAELSIQPDLAICSLVELLQLFPGRPGKG
jgi:putative hydrolase of the HAD superfamily